MKCHHPSIIFKSDVPKFGRGDEEGEGREGGGEGEGGGRKVGFGGHRNSVTFKGFTLQDFLYILIIDNLSSYSYSSFVSVCFMVVC